MGVEDSELGLNSDNVTKYNAAADIANRALLEVLKHAVAGAKILDLCILGDKLITDACEKVYTKLRDGKKIPKGISFPTCINVNNYICHLSPLASDPEADIKLKDGDVVSVELGAQIDGFPASVACTSVVGASKSKPVSGKTADAIKAAYTAYQVAVRLLKPGKNNFDITDAVQKIVKDEFECIPVEGIMSSQVVPVTGEGDKQIIFNPSAQQRSDISKADFELGEVYTMDILVSTGNGKAKVSSARTTIYKRLPDATYSLKMQTSRRFLSEAQSKFGYMPFNLRNMDNEKSARAGVVECIKNNLVLPYAVLEEAADCVVIQFMSTVLLMPNGAIHPITTFPYDETVINSDKSLKDKELLDLIAATPLKTKKK